MCEALDLTCPVLGLVLGSEPEGKAKHSPCKSDSVPKML